MRLRADLVRDGVVKGGTPLNDRMPAAPDDNQQPSAVPLRLEHDAVFALDEANSLVVAYVDRQKPQIFGAFGQILHAAIDAAGST